VAHRFSCISTWGGGARTTQMVFWTGFLVFLCGGGGLLELLKWCFGQTRMDQVRLKVVSGVP